VTPDRRRRPVCGTSSSCAAVECPPVRRIVGYLGLAVVAFVAGVAVTIGTDPVDWHEQQWVDVAEWVGGLGTALALLLGLGILARDHADAARGQVDLVGAWQNRLGTYEELPSRGSNRSRSKSARGTPVNYLSRWRNSAIPFTPPGWYQRARVSGTWFQVPSPCAAFLRTSSFDLVTFTRSPHTSPTWPTPRHRMQCNISPSQVSDAASTGS
jgi:hypothetical protein